ncbi:MAG: DUF6701 domain-containing protein [Pseudomonadota bacterium]
MRWLAALLACLIGCGNAQADTPVSLYHSYAGNLNFVGTQKTMRTKSNSQDACAVSNSNSNLSASLSGIPATATITAAYLYWAGSGATPDYTVTFEGASVTATRQYTIDAGSSLLFFSGAADVTAAVTSKRNGTYTLSNLTIDTSNTYCNVETVLGGWALLAIYSDTSETFRVLNVYEGFQYVQNSSIPLSLTNFRIPSSGTPVGRVGHLTWEGDPTLSGGGETLVFNSNELTDTLNPSGNQFNSASSINSDASSYGIDFDAYTITTPVIQNNQTTATTTYTSGQDLVLLNMEIIAVPNVPVADLALTMATTSSFIRGQNVVYTMGVSNSGPNTATSPVTVTDTLPSGLTYVSGSGTGWSCSAAGQVVTCTNGALASGASAGTLTLTASVDNTASGSLTNTSTVSNALFDNVPSNNTVSTTNSVLTVDLSLAMARGASLVPGQQASYTLTVANTSGATSETGPITIVDTLPTGLSYVSASSSGSVWSCGASGQTVTCTRTGTLAIGATAPVLTLTVSVAANATGTLVNTATVTGTSYDATPANNTASDSYSLITTLAYAYYKMDEASWSGASGEVHDSSSNATLHNGIRIGTATTVVSTNPTSECRAATIAANTTGPVQDAVSVPVTPQDLGLSGSIAFWYKGTTAWNDGTARMLFDATADANSAQYAFYLMRNTGGSLKFGLTDSANVTPFLTTSTSYTFAANTWHHIAVTWAVAAGSSATTLQIYVDASLAGTLSTTTTGAWPTGGNANTSLYFGDTHTAGTTVPWQGTLNSANGNIDEVYLYTGVLSAANVATLMSTSHTCSSLNHFELSLPSASVNCQPSTVTVTACSDASSPCTSPYTAADTSTATLSVSGGATLGATTVTFGPTGTATTTLNYPAAAQNATAQVTLASESLTPLNLGTCCLDSTSCSVSTSCTSTFHQSALIFSSTAGGASLTLPAQIAGTTAPSTGTYYLRAVRSSASSVQACESALVGAHNINFAYICNDPSTCAAGGTNYLSINGGTATTVQGNANAAAASPTYTSVPMTFDNSGNAGFTLRYSDVGRITLKANVTLNSIAVTGTSNAFIVRPADFTWGAITNAASVANPAANAVGGTVFTHAGDTFNAIVNAVGSTGAITPSFGRESTSENIKFDTPTRGLTAGGATIGGMTNVPPVGNVAFTFTNGVGTGSMNWPEVGIIQLLPRLSSGSYLGGGSDVVSTHSSGNIGRFFPHHFAISNQAVGTRSAASCPVASTFNYMSEPFTVAFTLQAQTSGNVTTQNYADTGFGKLTPAVTDWLTGVANTNKIDLRLMGTGFAATTGGTCSVAFDLNGTFSTRYSCVGGANPAAVTNDVARVAVTGATAPTFTGGVSNLMTATVRLLRGTSFQDGPYDTPNTTATQASASPWLQVGIAPQDDDGVAVSAYTLDADIDGTADHAYIGSLGMRYGRMLIPNVYGSEKLNLPIEVKTQYWSNGRWLASSDDNCTPLSAANFVYGTLGSGTATTALQVGSARLSNGSSANNLFFSKPSNTMTSKATISMGTSTVNPVGAPLNTYVPGTTGYITFGVYKAGPVIFVRESY